MAKIEDRAKSELRETVVKLKKQIRDAIQQSRDIVCSGHLTLAKPPRTESISPKLCDYGGSFNPQRIPCFMFFGCACGGVYDPAPIENYLDWLINWVEELAILEKIHQINPELVKERFERLAKLQGLEKTAAGK